MIQVFFTKNSHEWSNDQLQQMLLPMPEDIRHKILAYKNWQARQSRILGKWLLTRLLEKFDINLTLSDLKYTGYNKPYFEASFDFSIAHSGNLILCAGTDKGAIGADIELISSRKIT